MQREEKAVQSLDFSGSPCPCGPGVCPVRGRPRGYEGYSFRVKALGDIHCSKCGEPWDAWGVYNGDMTSEEKDRFLRGEGCPCCKFGEKEKELAVEG